MSLETNMRSAIRESGMTIKAVSTKSGIPCSRMYQALSGRTELRANEYLTLCRLLNLDPYEIAKEVQS